jgi:hypothetical protein
MKRFLVRSTILTLGFFILGLILYIQVIPQYYQNIYPVALIFFFLATNLVHAYLLRIAGKDMPKFTTRYMALSFLKMLFYLVVAVVFIYISKDQVKPFLINYLSVYVGFTILEVAEISRVVKINS